MGRFSQLLCVSAALFIASASGARRKRVSLKQDSGKVKEVQPLDLQAAIDKHARVIVAFGAPVCSCSADLPRAGARRCASGA